MELDRPAIMPCHPRFRSLFWTEGSEFAATPRVDPVLPRAETGFTGARDREGGFLGVGTLSRFTP